MAGGTEDVDGSGQAEVVKLGGGFEDMRVSFLAREVCQAGEHDMTK